jgi:uncharacterized membrane protein YczE
VSKLRRWTYLLTGLSGYGIGLSFIIRAGIGADPWSSLHLGLSGLSGLTPGTVSILVGIVLLAVSVTLLGVRVGAGTIANVLVVGPMMDLGLLVLAPAGEFVMGVVYIAAGVLIIGLSTGCYLKAAAGAGPRDGFALGLAERTGLSIRAGRTATELTVLAIGWWLGVPPGIGTVLFAIGIGPSAQVGIRLFRSPPVTGRYATDRLTARR